MRFFVLVFTLIASLSSMSQSMEGGAMNSGAITNGVMNSGVMDALQVDGASSPPSDFVCRLEPSSLAADFADLDPIDAWVADAASTKGTECDFVQTVGGEQPEYNAACPEFGGEACADFNSDGLAVASALTTAVSYPFSICFISALMSAVNSTLFRSGTVDQGLVYQSIGTSIYYHDTVPGYDVYAAGTAIGVGSSICMTFAGSGVGTLQIDGTSVTGSLGAHVATISEPSIGKGLFGTNVRIAEMVIYDRDMTSEISEWYAYTCAAYGLGC